MHRLRALCGHLPDRGDAPALDGPRGLRTHRHPLDPQVGPGPPVPDLPALGPRLHQQAGRAGEDPRAARRGPLRAERRQSPGPALGGRQRRRAGPPDRPADHRVDEDGQRGEARALRRGAARVVRGAVGRRRRSGLPGRPVRDQRPGAQGRADRGARGDARDRAGPARRTRARPRHLVHRQHQHRRPGVSAPDRGLGVPHGYLPYGSVRDRLPARAVLRIPTRRPADVIWQ